MPASPVRNQNSVQNPMGFPPRLPQAQQKSQQSTGFDVPQKIFLAALQEKQDLISGNPKINPVDSQHIDAIGHAMWQVVFRNEPMMREATAKAAMFSQLKLRALARLNYLPTWWFLRDMACSIMTRSGWLLNDNDMQNHWKETLTWCNKVEIKMGLQSDGGNASRRTGGGEGQDAGGEIES